MSKTDKTNPFWVKLMHGDLATEEVHRHEHGPCTLPPVGADEKGWGWEPEGCYRDFRYTGTHVCCCHMCHSSDEYELRPGKRQRLEGKAACRDWEDDE